MFTGDKVLAIDGDPYLKAGANIAFTAIKDEVGNFVENSKIMMKVMDEVGKIHPFIQGDLSQIQVPNSQHITDLYIRSRRIGLQGRSELGAPKAR